MARTVNAVTGSNISTIEYHSESEVLIQHAKISKKRMDMHLDWMSCSLKYFSLEEKWNYMRDHRERKWPFKEEKTLKQKHCDF